MKIVLDHNNCKARLHPCTFGELKDGDLFRDNNLIYEKINKVNDWNAVVLATGSVDELTDCTPVEKYVGEVHIDANSFVEEIVG